MKGGLDLLHEGVEMDPPFRVDRHPGMEKIHQHRLAAPDAAPKVKTADRVRRLAEKAPKKPLSAPRPVFQSGPDTVQFGQERTLRRILAQVARMGHPVVDFGQRLAHAPR